MSYSDYYQKSPRSQMFYLLAFVYSLNETAPAPTNALANSTIIPEINNYGISPDRIRQRQCFSIIRQVRRHLSLNSSNEELTRHLDMACDRIRNPDVKKTCQEIKTKHLTKIIEEVNDYKTPDFICDGLGYRREGAEKNVTENFCINVVTALKEESKKVKVTKADDGPVTQPKVDDPINQPKPEEESANKGRSKMFRLRDRLRRKDGMFGFPRHFFPIRSNVCKDFEASEQAVCHQIVRYVYRNYNEELTTKGTPPQEVCKSLEANHFVQFVKETKKAETKETQ